MEVYATEEQQLEAIKKWFSKYGNTILWSITLILAVIAGARYWMHHQTVLQNEASEYYAAMMKAVEQKDEATVKNKAQTLLTQFPKSSYATFAAFTLAAEEIKQNNLAGAQQNLEWVTQHSKQDYFKTLARIRLMKLWIAENKLEEALGLYEDKKGSGFATIMEELKGDILVKQKKWQLARESYEKAMAMAPEEGMYGPLLKMKLEDLGSDPHLIEAKLAQAKLSETKTEEAKTDD